MKAREMAQRINLAENRITKRIADAIHEELRELVAETGLDVDEDLTISLIETTRIDSEDREYQVSSVSIGCRLPRPIG